MSKTKQSGNTAEVRVLSLDGMLLKKMTLGGVTELRANADEVNRLNVFPVPDGDTGDNMRMTVEGGISAIRELETDDASALMSEFARGALLGARGNSGVILSQFFQGIAEGLNGATVADIHTLVCAFEAGVKKAYSAVVKPCEGTILTVAREAVEYAAGKEAECESINDFFALLCSEMKASLNRTPDILPVLKEAGVVDSGGAGLMYIMNGLYRVLLGDEPESDTIAVIPSSQNGKAALTSSFGADSEMTYGYCTEFLLQLRHSKTDIASFDVDALKNFLTSVGDSVVAFKNDSIVKVHVHTFTPDKVIAYCLGYGDFLTMKIENMSVQHTELEGATEEKKPAIAKTLAATKKKKYGIVAVTNGDGITELFKELGCDECIFGGQTQNPSTSDLLEAFEKVGAEHIFVFPNNGNILLAAKQAARLYEKANIHVIESKSIGEGYAALASLELDSYSPNAISAQAKAAMSRVTCGQVAPAVRDAKINGVRIYKGDTIGIIGKEIVLSEADRHNAASKLAEMLLDHEDRFMLTVFCGKDASDEDKSALESELAERCPDAEIYFHDGGQDIYPFIFVAE